MNQLPENVVLNILEQLDNDSLLNTLRSSSFFANIFSSSTKLLLMFNLFIGQLNIEEIIQDKSIANIPFKNVTIYNFATRVSPELQEIADKFQNSIEILKLDDVQFDEYEHFENLISKLKNLKSLNLEKCYVGDSEFKILPPIPTLKSVTFNDCRESLFKLFKKQTSIEKVSIVRHQWTSQFSHSDFNEMASTLPNLKHLVMDGMKAQYYFDEKEFPFKIQKLEAYSMTSSSTQTVPRLDFLKSQQGYLKEVTIQKLPYDYDGGEVLKFAIEEMGLEKFYYGKIPLILDGKKQEVKEFTASELNIEATFEMFRQFPSIDAFTLYMTKTDVDQSIINNIINPQTEIFQNLKHLDVLDQSGSLNHPSKFIGLYKNCRNITKLSLRTDSSNVDGILSECLPYFTNLNEIYLTIGKEKSSQRFEIIKTLAPNLKKLSVSKEVVEDAKNAFGSDVEITDEATLKGNYFQGEHTEETYWMEHIMIDDYRGMFYN